MVQKPTLILDKEFILYCELNKIDNIEKLAKETFNRGFSLLKYGETPTGNSTVKEKIVEVIKEVEVEKVVEKIVEVEKEVVKEVPVEILKEVVVEVIKEVPVEVVKEGKTKTITKEVIKEVPVIKEVQVIKEVKDEKEIEKLKIENKKLKDELDKITTTLTKMNKAKFMKNSDLNSLYDE